MGCTHGASSVVSLNRRKLPRWFPSSAPSEGMQQEFIVTPTQPTILHRCTQQSTPKNSQRADDRCAFFTIRASLDEHILGLPPWVFCRICRKNFFFEISTHQWPNVIIDTKMFGLWKTIPIHDCLTELCFFFPEEGPQTKTLPYL